MSILQQIVLFTAFSGALSALAAGVFLTLGERWRTAVLPHLVSFATGTLLGAAFLGLIPHALEGAGPAATHKVGLALLFGILVFFLLEKFVLWRHCHDDPCEVHSPGLGHHGDGAGHDHDAARDHASANLILVGDTFHNLLDGVLVAAAFMTNPHLGVVTALAVFAHEIPQEVGDLAILLHGGYSRRRAMTLNLLSSLTSIVGGVLAYYALNSMLGALPYALAFAAASFIYVAVADLIPGLHRRVDARASLEQFVLIAAGVALVAVTHGSMH